MPRLMWALLPAGARVPAASAAPPWHPWLLRPSPWRPAPTLRAPWPLRLPCCRAAASWLASLRAPQATRGTACRPSQPRHSCRSAARRWPVLPPPQGPKVRRGRSAGCWQGQLSLACAPRPGCQHVPLHCLLCCGMPCYTLCLPRLEQCSTDLPPSALSHALRLVLFHRSPVSAPTLLDSGHFNRVVQRGKHVPALSSAEAAFVICALCQLCHCLLHSACWQVAPVTLAAHLWPQPRHAGDGARQQLRRPQRARRAGRCGAARSPR